MKKLFWLLNNGMGRFRTWLVESLQSQKLKELQTVWADTFKALGVGGLSDEDAAQQSLSKITFGDRNPHRNAESTFKGKQAVRKRLENGQIFARLERYGDPELKQSVEDTRRWLDLKDKDHAANGSTTVSTLLQKLFGDKYFQQFIDQDFPKTDQAKAQVQPQPPKDSTGTPAQTPDGSMTQPPDMTGQQGAPPPNGGPPGGQPQAQQGMSPPPPNNPMPPKPAGAEMGLF